MFIRPLGVPLTEPHQAVPQDKARSGQPLRAQRRECPRLPQTAGRYGGSHDGRPGPPLQAHQPPSRPGVCAPERPQGYAPAPGEPACQPSTPGRGPNPPGPAGQINPGGTQSSGTMAGTALPRARRLSRGSPPAAPTASPSFLARQQVCPHALPCGPWAPGFLEGALLTGSWETLWQFTSAGRSPSGRSPCCPQTGTTSAEGSSPSPQGPVGAARPLVQRSCVSPSSVGQFVCTDSVAERIWLGTWFCASTSRFCSPGHICRCLDTFSLSQWGEGVAATGVQWAESRVTPPQRRLPRVGSQRARALR